MTFIAWLLELITGIASFTFVAVTTAITGNEDSIVLMGSLAYLIIYSNFIVTPATYLLNTEVIKGMIVAEGWYNGIKHAIFTSAQKNVIVPDSELEEKHNKREIHAEIGPIPNPIPTISGNIHAMANVSNPTDKESYYYLFSELRDPRYSM